MPRRPQKHATRGPDWRGKLMKETAALYAKLGRAPRHQKAELHQRIAELTRICNAD